MELKPTFTSKRFTFLASIVLSLAVLYAMLYAIASFSTVDTANMNDETLFQHLNTTPNELTIMDWVVFRVNTELNNLTEDNKPLHAISLLQAVLPNKYVHHQSVRFLPDENLFEAFVVFTEQPFMSLSAEDKTDAINLAYDNIRKIFAIHLSKYKLDHSLDRYLKVRFLRHTIQGGQPMASIHIAVIKNGKLKFTPLSRIKQVR